MTGWILLATGSATLLTVAWVAYPWLMIRLGERRPNPAPGQAFLVPPTVSVVVATREPPPAVVDRVKNLLEADWPAERLEVVVAVDGDPAPYRGALLPLAERGVRVVAANPPGGKACALNAGVLAAGGEVLVFADTAQRFVPGAISALASALADRGLAAVTGMLHLPDEGVGRSPATRYWMLERRLRCAEAAIHSTVGVTGAVWALRSEHWQPLPAGLILDDLWTPMRLILGGQRIGIAAEAVAIDPRAPEPASEFRRKTRTLTGNFQLLAWMPEVLLPWRNPVWVQFTCHKLLRLLTPVAALLFGVGAAGAAATRWSWPLVGYALAGGTALLLLAVAVPGRGGRLAGGSLRWAAAMAAATVVALWHGLRGHWGVWDRTTPGMATATPSQPTDFRGNEQ